MNADSVWKGEGRQKAPTVEDIMEARRLLDGTVRKTPLQYSSTFSKLAGTNVYLKLECLQLTGSFKVRGALAKLGRLSEKQAQRVRSYLLMSVS